MASTNDLGKTPNPVIGVVKTDPKKKRRKERSDALKKKESIGQKSPSLADKILGHVEEANTASITAITTEVHGHSHSVVLPDAMQQDPLNDVVLHTSVAGENATKKHSHTVSLPWQTVKRIRNHRPEAVETSTEDEHKHSVTITTQASRQ